MSLHEEDGHEVAGNAGNAGSAVALACQLMPDVIILDIAMPGSELEPIRSDSSSRPEQ